MRFRYIVVQLLEKTQQEGHHRCEYKAMREGEQSEGAEKRVNLLGMKLRRNERARNYIRGT